MIASISDLILTNYKNNNSYDLHGHPSKDTLNLYISNRISSIIENNDVYCQRVFFNMKCSSQTIYYYIIGQIDISQSCLEIRGGNGG